MASDSAVVICFGDVTMCATLRLKQQQQQKKKHTQKKKKPTKPLSYTGNQFFTFLPKFI